MHQGNRPITAMRKAKTITPSPALENRENFPNFWRRRLISSIRGRSLSLLTRRETRLSSIFSRPEPASLLNRLDSDRDSRLSRPLALDVRERLLNSRCVCSSAFANCSTSVSNGVTDTEGESSSHLAGIANPKKRLNLWYRVIGLP